MEFYPQSVTDRFWAKVDRSGGPDACWPWTASLKTTGYGQFGCWRGVKYRPSWGAHQIAWEMVNGAIPEGLHCLHHCDNPPCCNPTHLYVGTRSDNMRDAFRRHRNPTCSGKHWKWTEHQRMHWHETCGAAPRRRHYALSKEQGTEAARMREEGMSYRAIGRLFGVTHGAVKGAIERLR